MKVLVVSHLYPSPGHERHLFVEDQVRALRALGVELRVLSPTGYAPRPLWVNARLRRRGTTPSRAVREGVLVEYPRVPVIPRSLFFSRSGDLSYLALRRRLPSLRGAGVDLVHAHQAMPDGATARRLAADLGVPYVVTVHGRDAYHHLKQSGAVGRVTREVLHGAAAVMAVSSAVAAHLAPFVPPQRLHIVPNGIVAEPASPGALARQAGYLPTVPLVLSVGYLIERKGHMTVLEALTRLKGHVQPHYAIVGEGPLRRPLERAAARLGLTGQVHFLGRLPHDDVLGLMARADLFVLPSWDEAFGLVYAEAMAQGTPVAGCRGEGLEDFVEDAVSGYLVPARDAEALAEVIARVIEDPATAGRAGEAGRAAVADLTWARNAERQRAIYDQVLAGRHAVAQHDSPGAPGSPESPGPAKRPRSPEGPPPHDRRER